MKSIRKELLLTLLPAVLLLIGVAVLAVLYEVRDEIGELFDAQLVQAAFAVPATPAAASDNQALGSDDPMRDLVIGVWTDGEPAPAFYSSVRAPLEWPSAIGFSRVTFAGEKWRVYVRSADKRRIMAAQPLRVRSEASADIALGMVLPMLLLIPVVVITVLFLLKRGLRPLTHFAAELDSRSSSALKSVPVDNLPAELLPMATAMNQLLDRLQTAMKAQEVFVADAAHELLTPLAALQVQVQMLERATSDDRRMRFTGDVRTSLTRCIDLARQLLTLARHSAAYPANEPASVQLSDAVRASVSEVLPKAHARGIDLGVASDADCDIVGDDKAIQTLLTNFLDNAIKYSPAGGRVDVSIDSSDGHAVIVVSDNGPGIPSLEQSRVFDRFYRGNGVDAEGSGLGLAIAQEIATRHSARIELKTPGRLGGLDVIVTFPRA